MKWLDRRYNLKKQTAKKYQSELAIWYIRQWLTNSERHIGKKEVFSIKVVFYIPIVYFILLNYYVVTKP